MVAYYLLGVLIAFLFSIVWARRHPKPYPGIPYNKESAKRVVGDVAELFSLVKTTEDFSTALFNISTKRLGVPVAQVLFPSFRKPLITLDDPREVEDVILRRGKEFDKGAMMVDHFLPIFPKASISQYTTPECRAQKKMWADVMSTEFLRKTAAPNIRAAAMQLLSLWQLKASQRNQPFQVLEDLENTTLDVIWASLVGEDPGLIRHEIERLRLQLDGDNRQSYPNPPQGAFLRREVRYITQAMFDCSTHPIPAVAHMLLKITSRYREFRTRAAYELELVMKRAIERIERRSTHDHEADASMLDFVLRRRLAEAKKTNTQLPDPWTDQSMIDEMFVLIVGGYESSASSVAWFVKFMEAYPAVQTELRQALNEAFSGSKLPSAEDIIGKNIPFLDATVEESFRLAGAAGGNVRQATMDTEILGCKVPKGAQVYMKFHIDRDVPHIDESQRTSSCQQAAVRHGDGPQSEAGRNLGRFNPRRWLSKDAKTGKDVFNPHALPSLAFGGGYRGCPGRKLATMEFRMLITLLVLNLEFLALPEALRGMAVKERIFRQPTTAYAQVKTL